MFEINYLKEHYQRHLYNLHLYILEHYYELNHDLFLTVNKNLKIFKSQYTGLKELPKLYNYSSVNKNYEEPKPISFKNEEELLEEKIVEATSKFILNQSVLINSSNDIVYMQYHSIYTRFRFR